MVPLPISGINDPANCKGANGKFSIGVWEINDENYETLSHCLSNIICECENITELILAGVSYRVQFYLGGDMKFLLNIYGNLKIA